MTIGKVAEQAGVTVETIRFYERQGLLKKPRRSPAGYRLYEEGALGRLRFIRKASHIGLSLAEIGEILHMADADRAPCRRVRDLLSHRLKELDRKIADLEELRDDVQRFVDSIAGFPDQSDASESVCALIETLPIHGEDADAVGKVRSTHRPRRGPRLATGEQSLDF